MYLDSFLGNTEVVSSLTAALAGGRLSHAVILSGADGCGRGFAARLLAADFLFPHTAGAQHNGAMAVLRGEPSSEVLLVQGEGASGQIPVDRIRAVRQDVFRSSLSAAGRVVLIKDAHRMAAPAYNALLKVLEEPPASVLFIFTVPDAASLPLTIQSRCALYPLAPLSEAACQKALQAALPQGADARLPALLAAVYGGRLGAGLRVMQDAERLGVLQDALALAKAAGEGSHPDRYTMLRVFSGYEGRAEGDREKREALLKDCADVLATCMHSGAAGTSLPPGLPRVPPAVCAALLPAVLRAQQALPGNAAPKITFAALTVQLANAAV